MSKTVQKFVLIGIWLIGFGVFTQLALAQTRLEATITLKSDRLPMINVGGRYSDAVGIRAIRFDRSSGGVVQNGRGITDLKIFDAGGQRVDFLITGPQAFLADVPVSAFTYSIDLETAGDPRSAAHLSWVTADRGVLMLRDILPEYSDLGKLETIDIHFDLPNGWIVAGGGAANSLRLNDIRNAVVVIGNNVRIASPAIKDTDVIVNVTGNRHYTETEAAAMAVEIVEEYRKIFGRIPFRRAQISLVEHAQMVPPGFWTAETRGTNVTIVSSDMEFPQRSLQRLHEQLRHEIFHLWMPNAVNFSGHYDWFYEGVAMYESLKIGVGLNRLTFSDLLDTLSRAYAVDRLQKRQMPMAEASAGRFFGGESQVYARGMLLAFLTDIEMLEHSGGKRSVETLVRNVFDAGSNASKKADGNMVIVAEMLRNKELTEIVSKYVKGGSALELPKAVEAAGLEFRDDENGGRLVVKTNPNDGQKRLLDKLGYNSWRKLIRRK